MSAPAFRSLFNTNIFKFWFDKKLSKSSNKNIGYSSFVHTTRTDSKSFVNNTMVDFVLPLSRLESMVGSGDAKRIFDQIRKETLLEGIEYRKSPSGQEQIFISNLKFSTLNSTVTKILDSIGNNAGIPDIGLKVESQIKNQSLDRGHVFGFGNTLLFRTKQEIRDVAKNNGDISNEQIQALEEWIDALIDVLESYDIATSDIRDLDAQIYLKYRKTDSNWLIEWQGSEENSGSGAVVGRLLGRTGTKTFTGARGVFTGKATEEVVKNFIQQFVDESVAAPESSKLNLLRQKSSPAMLDMLTDTIVSTLSGKKKSLKEVYTGTISLPRISVTRKTGSNKASLNNTKNSLKAAKNKIKALKNSNISQSYSVTSLQTLLEATLVDRIKQNMGNGTRRDILNLRSGRFAESVKVERLSESRSGMITAFYSYMKNPYATFSAGGRQSSPSSRDPKLLIARSIREIAQTQVANRLRSVSV